MNNRSIIVGGFALTALLTSVVVWELIPDMVTAVMLLAAGLFFTYYWALADRLRQALERKNLLIRGWEAITLSSNPDEVRENLQQAIGKLTPLASAPVLWKQEAGYEPLPGWADQAVQEFERQQPQTGSVSIAGREGELPSAAAMILVIPVTEGRLEEGLLLLPLPDKSQPSVALRSSLQTLARAALKVDDELRAQARVVEDWQTGHDIVIRALETGTAFQGHSGRVTQLSEILGQRLGLELEEKKVLVWAARLHDVGRTAAGNGAEVDNGEGLDHASRGAAIIGEEGLWGQVAEAVRHHHERYDGSGYPDGLRQTEIPFPARIIAVADIFDALTCINPEEERLDRQQALQVIRRGSGTRFDPLVVVALEEIVDRA